MPRAVALLFVVIVVATSSTTARGLGNTPAGYKVVARTDMYTGVEYLKLAKPTVPVIAHVAHVSPGAPVDLKVVNANDKISTNTRELETTSSMCRRVRCIVGLNGDFHRLGEPTGAVVMDGRMLHSPHPAFPQLTVTSDGRLQAGLLPWSASLTLADGQQIAVNAVNTAPPAGGIALYTPAYGARTDPSSRTEILVKSLGAVGTLNRPTDLDLRGIRNGAGTIPADGAVLSGDGAAAGQLLDVWSRRQQGMAPRARLLVSSTVDAYTSIGAEPVVLRDGRRALPWRDPNIVNPRQPHTLVGWNKAGDIYLVAVDGRQTGSEGVTMGEAADFLLGLGATDAVSLDGGGGTTFAAGGSLWNRPSDNDPVRPTEYEERGAANAFVLTAPPGAPLPPESPPAPGSPGAPAPGPAPGTTAPSTQPGKNTIGAPGVTPRSGPSSHPPIATDPDGSPFGPITGAEGTPVHGGLPVGPLPADLGFAGRLPAELAFGPGSAAAPSGAAPLGTPPPPTDQAPGGPVGEPEKATRGDLAAAVADLPAPMAVASALGRFVGSATGEGPIWKRSTVVVGMAALGGVALLTALAARRRMVRLPQ